MENVDQLFSPVVILSMLPWMLLFAWIARRLLGAKNLSLTSTFISGAAGYAAGLGLAIAIFGLPDEPGFDLNHDTARPFWIYRFNSRSGSNFEGRSCNHSG